MAANDIDTLVIACMDYRLNAVLDEKYNDGHMIFLRNAGGDVAPLIGDIEAILSEHPGIKKIIVVKHTNEGTIKENELTCGGAIVACMMAGMMNIPLELPEETKEQIATLLKSDAVKTRFGSSRDYARQSKNLREFEVDQSRIQAFKELEEHFGHMKITVRVEVERVDAKDANSHLLLIGAPTTRTVKELARLYGNEDILRAYIILTPGLSMIEGDVKAGIILAKMNKLHIETVHYLAPEFMTHPAAEMESKRISRYGSDIAVTPMMASKNGAKSRSRA